MADSGFGGRVRTVRARLGVSQEDLAHDAGVTQKWLSQLENGQSRVRLEDAEAIGRALIARWPNLSLLWVLTGSGAMVEAAVHQYQSRRLFLQRGVSLLPAALVPMIPDVDRWMAPSLDAALLDDLQGLTEHLARLRPSLAPGELLPQVESHLLTLGTRVALQSGPPALRERLLSVAGGTAALAGWLCFMLERRREARDYLEWAEPLVVEAKDDEARSLILMLRADLASAVPTGGEGGSPERALHLLERARALTKPEMPECLRVPLLLRSAEELACMDRAEEALRLVEEAERMAAVGTATPPYYLRPTWRGSERFLAGFKGNIFQLLGQSPTAIEILSGTPGTGYAADVPVKMVDLAAAHARAGDLDHACELLGKAIELLGSYDLPVATQRIAGIRRRHLDRWKREPLVLDLDERLASLA